MLFKKEHVKMIKTGKKTMTRRLWKKPHAKIGGIYPIQVTMFQPKTECPLIQATAVYQQRLGDMTEKDAQKEGEYTLEEFKEVFEKVTKTVWDDNQVVWVVEFRIEGG